MYPCCRQCLTQSIYVIARRVVRRQLSCHLVHLLKLFSCPFLERFRESYRWNSLGFHPFYQIPITEICFKQFSRLSVILSSIFFFISFSSSVPILSLFGNSVPSIRLFFYFSCSFVFAKFNSNILTIDSIQLPCILQFWFILLRTDYLFLIIPHRVFT